MFFMHRYYYVRPIKINCFDLSYYFVSIYENRLTLISHYLWFKLLFSSVQMGNKASKLKRGNFPRTL